MIHKGFITSPELSGLQAIKAHYLMVNGHLRGFEDFCDDVIAFSGLGDFIHLPVKTYSQGMAARLLFAVLTGGSHDCLAMDEGFGAGDTSFYEKAEERMTRFLSSAGTLLLASHSDELLRRFCRRGLVFDSGRLVFSGPLENALDYYHRNHASGFYWQAGFMTQVGSTSRIQPSRFRALHGQGSMANASGLVVYCHSSYSRTFCAHIFWQLLVRVYPTSFLLLPWLLVYGTVFKVQDFNTYVVYLGVGLVVWNGISSAIGSAPNLFEHNHAQVHNTNLNPIFYVLEEWAFQVQTFVQSFALVVLALSWFQHSFVAQFAGFMPGCPC